MELRYSTGRAEVDGKIITALDKFVIGFVGLLDEHNIKYVIVSGYVAILFGRARGTEDIDILVERTDASGFLSFYKSSLERGYDFLNPEDATGLYEMLCERLGIRAAVKDTVIPNMEMKFAKDDFDRYALSHRLEAVFNGEKVYISPIDMELSFDGKKNLEERIKFVHDYAAWVKKVPNDVWSKQQAALIDSFMENSKNFMMSREKYLEMADKRDHKRIIDKSN